MSNVQLFHGNCLETYTYDGNTVCDPTMGSGSCGEACQNTYRNFIGIEMDKAWYDYAQSRLNYHNCVDAYMGDKNDGN